MSLRSLGIIWFLAISGAWLVGGVLSDLLIGLGDDRVAAQDVPVALFAKLLGSGSKDESFLFTVLVMIAFIFRAAIVGAVCWLILRLWVKDIRFAIYYSAGVTAAFFIGWFGHFPLWMMRVFPSLYSFYNSPLTAVFALVVGWVLAGLAFGVVSSYGFLRLSSSCQESKVSQHDS